VKSKRGPRFNAAYAKLPDVVQRRARAAYRLFRKDPYHPSLQFKRVHNTKPIYSVRIGLDYRAVAVRQGDVIAWFWIGPHTEYEKLLKKL